MAAQSATPLLKVEGLKQYFKVNKNFTVKAVDDVSFEIYPGETYGLVGESGSGKSTIGRSIIRLYDPTAGKITFDGQDISGRLSHAQNNTLRTQMQMIFQDPMASLNPRKKVEDIIGEGLDIHHMYKTQDERREKVEKILEKVGLAPEHAERYPHQFSGGQRQRVGIARALATNPEILLADEATSALDPETTTEVLALLKRVNEEFGITIVLITHQMNVVQQIAGRVAVMSAGRVVESGDVYDVFAAPQQPVTKRFIATALSGLPEEDRVERLHHEWSGRIVTVLIRQKDVSGTQGHELKASGQNISELIAKYGVESSLLYGGIDTVKGTAIGAITYEFNGPGWHVDEFLRELAVNSDVIDFGTAAKPVAYADAVAGHAAYAEDRAHDPLAADTATASAASAAAHEGANA